MYRSVRVRVCVSVYVFVRVTCDCYTTANLSLPILLDRSTGFNQAEGKVQFGMHRVETKEGYTPCSLPIPYT